VNAPAPLRVYETVLYGDDVAELARFYGDVLGLRAVEPPDEHSAALRLADGGVLLLFDPARSSRAGRPVPEHGTTGAGHVAFGVAPGELGRWHEALTAQGIGIEREVGWGRGGRSLYVRDPAGNSVELVEGEVWPP
jgi:catechol 2,3-dioxygenase-like lactoylglutathione lyase family enzyme